MFENVLDSETFTTASGRTYRVDFVHDSDIESPHDNGDYMYPSIAWVSGRESRSIEPSEYTLDQCTDTISPEAVVNLLECGYGGNFEIEIAPRTIARWLRLRGATGIGSLDVEERDGSVSVTPWNFDAPLDRVDGFTWYNPGLSDLIFSDGDDIDARMRDEIAIYSAWREGDTFGYVTTEIDADGDDLGEVADGSVWGFYGLDREREYVMSEAKANAVAEEARELEEKAEAAGRAALQAMQAAQRLADAKADAADGLQLLRLWKRENPAGARAIWDGYVRAEVAAGHALLDLARASA